MSKQDHKGRELQMLANPKRMESIRRGVEEAKTGKSVRLDPIALLAELEGKKTPTRKSGRKDDRR